MTNSLEKAVSDEIGAVIGRRRISYKRVGQAAGLEPSRLSRLRSGNRRWTLDDLVAVGRALDIPADELLRRALAELDKCAPRESNPEPAD
jgi:transcriptional regulator with XRE-family HTH domain